MATTVPSNATAEIALYERRLNQLYDLVQKAARSIDPAANVVRTSMVQIDKQLTGLYSVPSLELSMSGKPGIRLVPKGIYNIELAVGWMPGADSGPKCWSGSKTADLRLRHLSAMVTGWANRPLARSSQAYAKVGRGPTTAI